MMKINGRNKFVTKTAKAIKGVFEGVRAPEVGKVYYTLCESFPLLKIETESQNEEALKVIERLIDFLNGDDLKPQGLIKDVEIYLSVLTNLVESFEAETYRKTKMSSSSEVLAYLMESNELKQEDLAKEVGGQSVVSEILSGKRELNTNQIQALATRFKISPAIFFTKT
jgi:HTH-type transcriptional regulator / antitoxin HigA